MSSMRQVSLEQQNSEALAAAGWQRVEPPQGEGSELLKKLQAFNQTFEDPRDCCDLDYFSHIIQMTPFSISQTNPGTDARMLTKMQDLMPTSIELLRLLVSLAEAASKHRPHNIEGYQQSRKAWKQAVGLAQKLISNRALEDQPKMFMLPNEAVHQYYSGDQRIIKFSKMLKDSIELVNTPTLDNAQKSLDSTEKLCKSLTDPKVSRLAQGFKGALMFLVGAVIVGCGGFLTTALSPTGIGWLPAIPLMILGCYLMRKGLERVIDTVKAPREPQPSAEKLAFMGQVAETEKSFKTLAKSRLSLFSVSLPSRVEEGSHQESNQSLAFGSSSP